MATLICTKCKENLGKDPRPEIGNGLDIDGCVFATIAKGNIIEGIEARD